jgi:hypothetical protein
VEFLFEGENWNSHGFNVRNFCKNLREIIPSGKNAWKAWWEPAKSDWENFALKLMKVKLPIRTKSTEEWVQDFRAWLHIEGQRPTSGIGRKPWSRRCAKAGM